MAKEQLEVSSVSSTISLYQENYITLVQFFFFETHDEANRLALANNRLKNWKLLKLILNT